MEKKISKQIGNHIPATSNYSSRKEWEDAVWRMIAKSPKTLSVLAAPNERHNLVMRAAVSDRVSAGRSYREISRELWSSQQTIRSIKKAIQENAYRSYRERRKTERKKRVYSKFSHRASWRSEPRRRVERVTYPISLSGITRTRYPDKLK